MPTPPPLSLFAATAPGLEPLAAAELAALGVRGRAEPGGVAWEGGWEDLMRANLELRTASRVLVRVAEFGARSFHELERHARRVPWADYLPPGQRVRLRTTAKKSKLYHEGAIDQRLLEAIRRATGAEPAEGAAAAAGEEEADEGAGAQLFVVRFHRDRCTLSADASGALLHLRGYRQAVARAPLRETLAAAILLGSGWRPEAPLVDPMCGSGTIPIEAALLARRIAPGLVGGAPREYAFLHWPGVPREGWARVVEGARERELPRAPAPIVATDRDAGAVEAALANARRAGVEAELEIERRPLSALRAPPGGAGWLVANPPYGVRVGETGALRDLYAALGNTARRELPGWTVALLGADPRLEAQTGLPWEERLRTRNGGIPVRLVTARVPG